MYEEYANQFLYELCVEDSAALAQLRTCGARRLSAPVAYALNAAFDDRVAAGGVAAGNISSDSSVNAAEALHASGHISFPRTEADEFEPFYD